MNHLQLAQLAVLLAATLIGGMGCASERVTGVVKPSVPGVTSTESVKTKITTADAQKRIVAVESDKTIPEAAKPGIIAGIRHDAGLQ
ncbi:MAG: hypothetical protein H8F28_02530 [Fibrella sp.]|nr:hypothetical protein [Armatimonadota bacterium]